ncbi:MAG: beta-lactamase family protein [Rhodospirillaceae bacterium]|nr:beta-lactamase family protein [Rhodospirillaceae bacterium]
MRTWFAAACMAACIGTAHAQSDFNRAAFDKTDRIFDEYRLDAHIPGLVYGIVMDGKLVHVKGFGIQDTDNRRPVTADSLFRIASMSKAFTALTILKLRDEGKLRLDAPAEDYVPEMKGWIYPTSDSPKITVRDLLSHAGGFVTDNPLGDRQTPMPEDEFTRILKEGVPLTRAPEMAYEYSNMGYGILGRIITNVSKTPYAGLITQQVMKPLGMDSTGYYADRAPLERRALGYRWEDQTWKIEPFLAHGALGAMGGVQTSANDYAKWVAFLLQAWPPRDGADTGPAKRATVRELSQGVGFASVQGRPGGGPDACKQPVYYGKAFRVAIDCDLGLALYHGGGYPGYGSHVVLFVDRGVGIFAFANRTYAGPVPPIWNAAVALLKDGQMGTAATMAVSDTLASRYQAIAAIYKTGDVKAGGDILALNFLMDRTAENWAKDLAALKANVGECDTSAPITPTGALSGTFRWRCANGRVKGDLLLSGDKPARIQSVSYSPIMP